MSKFIKNTPSLKIFWEKSPNRGAPVTLKHNSFVIIIKENRSLLEGDDFASVSQLLSYTRPQHKDYQLSENESEHRQKNFINTDYAIRVVEGKSDLVYNEMLLKVGASTEEFKREWKKAKYQDFIRRTANRGQYYNPFSFASPSKKITEELASQNLSITELTDRLKQTNKKTNYENIVNQVRGNRKITLDQALEYSKILGVDPSELVFDDLQTHIWGKVDLLNSNELEDLYDPGRIFTYYTKMNDAQVVTVPRNIWRSDIMAIKVTSPGSMYHNQVAFYYKSKDWSKAIPNRLCVMAVRVQMEELGIDESQYYFGIYEEQKGQINLINPDPYRKDEYILKNCKPEWTAPIVAMINPGLVKKSKITTDIVKEHSHVQKKHNDEERYKILVEDIKAKVMKTHDQTKKMNSELKKGLDALKKWQDDVEAVNNALKPKLFRTQEEELNRLKEKLLDFELNEKIPYVKMDDDEDKVA